MALQTFLNHLKINTAKKFMGDINRKFLHLEYLKNFKWNKKFRNLNDKIVDGMLSWIKNSIIIIWFIVLTFVLILQAI